MICEEQAVWYNKEEEVKRKANFPLCMGSFLQLVLWFGFFELSTSGATSVSILVEIHHWTTCVLFTLVSGAEQLVGLWCLYWEEHSFQLIIFQLVIQEEADYLNTVVSKLLLKNEGRCVLPLIPSKTFS